MIICQFENGGKDSLRHVVTDTIVVRGNKILLVKRIKKFLEGGKWGLIGGFVQRDEDIKQSVKREVFEETGWKIKDIVFLRVKDNPDRPHEDRQNIAFVFFCTATKKEGDRDWESDEVKWFDLKSLPSNNEIAFDHADDINLYKMYLEGSFKLPNL